MGETERMAKLMDEVISQSRRPGSQSVSTRVQGFAIVHSPGCAMELKACQVFHGSREWGKSGPDRRCASSTGEIGLVVIEDLYKIDVGNGRHASSHAKRDRLPAPLRSSMTSSDYTENVIAENVIEIQRLRVRNVIRDECHRCCPLHQPGCRPIASRPIRSH